MIIYPQKPWRDGQTFKHTASDGTELIGTYNAEKNVWTFYRTNEDGTGVGDLITTADVVTLNDRPTRILNPFSLTDDPSTVINQQEANWWLLEDIESILYVTDTAPGADGHQNRFWYDTDSLELYVWYEGAWFPTSVTSGGITEEVFTYSINRINSIIEEVYLKNINQDDRLDVLEENIVELEEEIDAIAPSVERGEWNFNPLVASPNNYTMLKGDGSSTDIFSQARLIFVSTTDADGNPHGFNNHEAGELLQIFNKDDDEYGLYEITDIDDNSSNSQNPYFSFTVDFVRAFSTVGKAINRGRFKFFNAPEGGTADGFVLKAGDKMSGNLTMVKEPFNNGDISPKIEFKSKKADGTVYTNQIYQPYNTSNTLYVNGPLQAKNTITSGGTLQAHGNLQYDSSTRMYLGPDTYTHYLGFGTSTNYQAIQWDKANGVTAIRAKNSYGSNGYVLTKTSNGVEWKAVPSSSPTYTISKDSNGNFYIS